MNLRTTMLAASMLAGVCLAPSASAQDDAALIEKRDKKLAAEWLKNAAWITDYDKAREEAKKQGKQIFAYFTRSYAP